MNSDPKILKALRIQLRSNFLPQDIVEELTTLMHVSQERKIIYELDTFPQPVIQTVEMITSFMNVPQLNKAILKRYVPGEPSGAFDFHTDPPEYKGNLYLCSLTGRATLTISTPDFGILELDCKPNSFIALPVHILHKVSPPDPQYGVRTLLFLGHSEKDV